MERSGPTAESTVPGGRILIVRGGAIGDFILTLPVLQALKSSYPRAVLHLLGYPQVAELARLAGLADQVQAIEAQPLAGFFVPNGPLAPDWRTYFAQFDVIVSYLYDPDHIFRDNVLRCRQVDGERTTFIQGPHRLEEQPDQHATQTLLAPLERLAVYQPDCRPRLALSGDGRSTMPPGRWLAIHPGSGSSAKNWPMENWRTLTDALIESTGWRLLLIGGEAERDAVEQLISDLPSERCRPAVCLPLTELAALIGNCEGFLGHDSGITHLAAALGLRGLALWGATNQRVWRPQSERFELLLAPNGITGIQVEEVLRRCRFWEAG